MKREWPFDQAQNVTAITTRQVLDDGLPVLRVVHYSGDHSWAFTCGTTSQPEDGRVICMASALALDPTLADIADLPPGWGACRAEVGAEWSRYRNESF